jgi:hypothetical protein
MPVAACRLAPAEKRDYKLGEDGAAYAASRGEGQSATLARVGTFSMRKETGRTVLVWKLDWRLSDT